jgi:hypothetical protein
MSNQEILLKIKPIMVPDLKSELEISVNPSITPIELVLEINEMYGTQGNFLFLFKGKKLLVNKTLKEQGIDKDNIKLLMNKSKEPLIPKSQNKETQNQNLQNNSSLNNDNMEMNLNNEAHLTPSYQRIENVRKQMKNKYKDVDKALE